MFRLRLLSFRHRGDAVFCNLCDKSFQSFLPYGHSPQRENAACPHCLSLERTRLLWLYMQKFWLNDDQIAKRLLHFAPEYPLAQKIKQLKKFEYISADLNPEVADLVVDITKIQFQDQHFDYIICSHVLGHVPDEAKAIKELFRVLKSDGEAVIMTRIYPIARTDEDLSAITPAQKLSRFNQDDVWRLHGADFAERIEAQGFIVEAIDFAQTFSQEIQQKHRLGTAEIIFKCTKQP